MTDGHTLPRPDWVNWIAQDGNGCWWGYSVEPLRHDSGWYENEAGRCVRLGHAAAFGWQASLQCVQRGTGAAAQKASASTCR